MMEDSSHSTPEPEGPPPSRMDEPQESIIFESDDESLPSLAFRASFESSLLDVYPSPLPRVVTTSPVALKDESSLFDDRSLEERLYRTLNRHPKPVTPRRPNSEPNKTILNGKPALRQNTKRTKPQREADSHQHLPWVQEAVSELDQEQETPRVPSGGAMKSIPNDKEITEIVRLTCQVRILTETNSQLAHENQILRAGGRQLAAEKNEWMEARTTAELKESEARQDCQRLKEELEHCSTTLEQDNAELKATLQSLTEERAMSQLKDEELIHLRNENSNMRQNIESLTHQLEVMNAELARVNGKAAGLEAQLFNSIPECCDRSVQTDPPSMQSSDFQTDSPTFHQLGTQTEMQYSQSTQQMQIRAADVLTDRVDPRMDAYVSQTVHQLTQALLPEIELKMEEKKSMPDRFNVTYTSTFNPSSIGERLSRIRDAAERATLLKEHQREISRLVAKHESELTDLSEAFEKEKEQLVEATRSEMNSRYKELKKRLQTEFEKKVDDMERKHTREIARVKEESEQASAAAAESVEIAMSQAATAMQQFESETKERESLEVRLLRLNEKYESDKKTFVETHTKEIQSLVGAWEEEKNSLLTMIQKECNSIFDRTKNTTWSSPRSVTTSMIFFPEPSPTEASAPKGIPTSPSRRSQVPKKVADEGSPAYSDLDRSLRETEAFVQMVLNGDSNR